MTNQEILDQIEKSIPPLGQKVVDKILDAVWKVLINEHGVDLRKTK